MANGDDIVQKVVFEVDDSQLEKLGESAQKSIDDIKESFDKLNHSLNDLDEKAGETKEALEKVGEGAGESLDKVSEASDKAGGSLDKLGEKAGEASKDLEKVGEDSGQGLEKFDEATQNAIDALTKLAEDGGHSFEEIQKAADYAGTALEDFAKLSEQTQEQYIHASKAAEEYAKSIEEIPKAAEDAAQGVSKIGPAMEGMGESAGHAHGNARALNLILRQFGLSEVGHIIHGLERVGYAFGAVGVAALAIGVATKLMYEIVEAAEKTGKAVDRLSESFSDGKEKIDTYVRALEAGGAKLKSIEQAFDSLALKVADAFNKMGEASEKSAESIDKARLALEKAKLAEHPDDAVQQQIVKEMEAREKHNAVKEAQRKLDEAMHNDVGKTVKALEQLRDGYNTLIDPMTSTKTISQSLTELFAKNSINIKDFGDGLKQAQPQAAQMADQLNKLYNAAQGLDKLRLKEAMKQLGIPEDVIQSITKTTHEWDELKKRAEDTKWQQDAFKQLGDAIERTKEQFKGGGSALAAYVALGIIEFGRFEHAVVDLVKALLTVPGTTEKIGKAILDAFTGLGEKIAEAAKKLGQYFLDGFIKPIGEGFTNLGTKIMEWLEAAGQTIAQAARDMGQAFIDGFIKPIQEAFNKVVQFVQDVWNTIVQYVTQKANAVIEAIKDAWKDFKQWAYDTFYKPVEDAWNAAVEFISQKTQAILDFLGRIKQAALDAWSAIKGMFSAGDSGGGGGVGAASGGYITGPGTSTSDSVPAWLSAGEFVVRAAAVQAYGLNALHRINSMTAPRFAVGGLAVPIPRSQSPSATGQRTLTLNIEGRSFQGLQIPERTAQSLERFAVHSQIASAGRKQSWRR